jgi:hypothetical protein
VAICTNRAKPNKQKKKAICGLKQYLLTKKAAQCSEGCCSAGMTLGDGVRVGQRSVARGVAARA